MVDTHRPQKRAGIKDEMCVGIGGRKAKDGGRVCKTLQKTRFRRCDNREASPHIMEIDETRFRFVLYY